MKTLFLPIVFVAAATAGCQSSPPAIPEPLASQVDTSVSFAQLKESPDSYRGRLVALGGQVLSAKRLKDGTRMEILQLPFDKSYRPAPDRSASQGRFYAFSKEFLDPATLTDGPPITLVGEVTGSQEGRLDEADYRYPTVDVKHLTVWDERAEPHAYGRPGVGVGVFGGVGMGGGGTRGGVGFGLGF